MHVREHALFPTRLLTIEFPDVADLNEQLYQLFTTRSEFSGDFAMHPDALNLLRLAVTCPAIARLRGMFLDGLARWLRAEQIEGIREADVVLFSNFARKGEFTAVHNHSTDMVGIYYVRTTQSDRPAVMLPPVDGSDDYFAAEDGALLLHDPRFNANLAGVRTRDYVKVFPRPGLMLLFPGYLWHSVTPHQGDFERLAISANFQLRWETLDNSETWPLPEITR